MTVIEQFAEMRDVLRWVHIAIDIALLLHYFCILVGEKFFYRDVEFLLVIRKLVLVRRKQAFGRVQAFCPEEVIETPKGAVEDHRLIDLVTVLDMHNLLSRCFMVMTDSGGLQEEAPHFGKPVLVMRTETERPEAVEARTVKVVGVDEEKIYSEAKLLLDDNTVYNRMARAVNSYGDGHACERIEKFIKTMVK